MGVLLSFDLTHLLLLVVGCLDHCCLPIVSVDLGILGGVGKVGCLLLLARLARCWLLVVACCCCYSVHVADCLVMSIHLRPR